MLLTIKNLSFGWFDELIFNKVSCHLDSGSVIQLKGENGSGKTTLLQILCGMVPHFSRSMHLKGDILFNGHSILHEPPKSFFPAIGYIPEKHNEFFLLAENLKEELLLVRAILNLTEKIVHEKFDTFNAFFPGFEQMKEIPYKSMLPQQKIMSLMFIYFLQGSCLYLFDEVIDLITMDYDLKNCFSFFEYLNKQQYSVIFISHYVQQTQFNIWEIKNKKITCSIF